MSNAAIDWALTVKTGSATRKAVLLALANRADHDGVCWPSIQRICDETELTERAVRQALRDMADAGLITRERRFGTSGVSLSDKFTLAVGRGHVVPPRGHMVPGEGACGARGRGHVVPPNPKREPTDEPVVDRARADGLRSLPDLIAEAGGVALNPTCPATMILSPVHGWLASGADLDLDILPTIRAVAATAPPHSIRTLAYFAGPVAKARDARLAGLRAFSTGPPRDRRESRTSATELALKRIKARAYGDT